MSGTVSNQAASAIPPQNIFSVGKDIQVRLVGPGGKFQLPKITGFSSDPQYDTAKSKPLDGPTIQADLPDGHNITIKFDRRDASVDALFTAIEAAYWALGGFVPTWNIVYYVTERATSTTSVFEFAEATLKYKPGAWKSGAPVDAEIMAFARYWRKVG